MVRNMRVFVVSDSHGRNTYLNKALEQAGSFDYLLHLGDLEGSEDFIEAFVETPKELISGNNDYFSDIEREKVIELEGHRIFMTHGNRYGVHAGVDCLREEGRKRGADIILFGHTHCPYIEQEDIIIVNPGSITHPRQEGRIPTYVIMDLKDNGEVEVALKYVKNYADEKGI